MSPGSRDRPLEGDVLHSEGVLGTEARRRAGATAFEGNRGPGYEMLAEDAEMVEV